MIQGVLSARYDFVNRFFAQLGVLVIQMGFLGFILLMKEWLQARGTFREYLAFNTYARFILLPLSLVTVVSTQLSVLLNFLVFLWILYAFYKTFQLVLSRFLMLVTIVWGIAFLAFVAAFITGLKLLG
ncbi:hypothetical protein EBT16_03210 [bacterium]|nr:hypothetical protein [bacterium]